MAIYQQDYRKQGSNGAQIDANYDWATAHRWRMTDIERGLYGAANALRIINHNTTAAICISFTFDVARTHSFVIKAGGSREFLVDDGINFYGFDVYSDHATENLAAGDIDYNIMWVKQTPEIAA